MTSQHEGITQELDDAQFKEELRKYTEYLITEGVQQHKYEFFNGFEVIFRDKKSSKFRANQKENNFQ